MPKTPRTTDWLCLWILLESYGTENSRIPVVFVKQGESLSASERKGYHILDVAESSSKRVPGSSSFRELIRGTLYEEDINLAPFLALAHDTENGIDIDPMSIDYYLKGLRLQRKDPRTREVDWQKVVDEAIRAFKGMYDAIAIHTTETDSSRLDINVYDTGKGVQLGVLNGRPGLRDEAFKRGADVVLWTQDTEKGYFVGIQVNRHSHLKLGPVALALRRREAELRGIKLVHSSEDAQVFSEVPGWKLNEMITFLSCGTRSNPLPFQELTKISHEEIEKIVAETLGRMRQK